MANNLDNALDKAKQDIKDITENLTALQKVAVKTSQDIVKVLGKGDNSQEKFLKLLTKVNTQLTKLDGLNKKIIVSDGQVKVKKNELALTMQSLAKQRAIQEKKEISDLKRKNKELKEEEKAIEKKNKALNKQNNTALKSTAITNKQSVANKGLIGTFKSLFQSIVAFVGVRMFLQFIKDTFELTKKLDSLNFAMLAITKSNKASADSMQFLQRITKSYGADIVSTTERYIRFLAAAKQSNVTLKDTNSIFETFTKVSGVLGMNTTDLTGIFLALEQMLSKGKVTTEELRRQLGERLPGAMGIMATSIGVTLPKLDEMLKKGEVLSAEVLPEFAKQVELSFGINSVTKVNTLAAAWVRLKNKWVEIFSEFSKTNNITKTLAKGLDLLTDNFADIVKNVSKALIAFAAYKVIVSVLNIKTALLTLNTKLLAAAEAKATVATYSLTASWAAFTTVLKANVIGIIVTAIIGVIWAIDHFTISLEDNTKALIKNSKEFVDATYKASEVSDSIDKMADSYNNLSVSVKQNNSEQKQLTDRISANEAEQRKLNKQVKEGSEDTEHLAEQLRLLHNEHIDLTDKTIKFKDEQLELDRVTRALSDAFPDAKEAVNDYGDAVVINTTKLKELNKEKRLSQLYDAESNLEGLKENLKELNKVQEQHNHILKFTNELATNNVEGKKVSEGAIKSAKKRLSGLENESDANKQLIIDVKLQIKANEALQFSYSDAGKAKALKDAEDLANAKLVKDAESERLLGLRNINNLTKEISALNVRKGKLERSDAKVRAANGKITTKQHETELDEILKLIELKQKEIDRINNKKEKTPKARGSKEKELYSLKTRIAINEIKQNIEKNKLIIEDDKSTQNQKEIALHDNYQFGRDILKLQETDRLAAVKDDKNSTDNKTLINQEYYAKILALGKKSGVELDKLRITNLKNSKKELEDKLAEIKKGLEEIKKISDYARNQELADANGNKEKIKEINEKYDKIQLEKQSTYIAEILRNTKGLTEAQIQALLNMINVIQIKLDDAKNNVKSNLQDVRDLSKEIFKGVTDTFSEMFDIDMSKFDMFFDGEKNSIKEWAELSKELIGSVLDASMKRYEIELQEAQRVRDITLNNDLASDEAKENARKKFDEQERKIKTEQAKKERENNLIKIAMDTAVAVTKTFAQMGFVAGLPLAAVMLGIGATQAALVASQPLPQFETGGTMGKDGWAITQEKRPEPIVDKFGNLKTMGSVGGDAMTYLNQGDRVFKSQDDFFKEFDVERSVFDMNMSSNGKMLNEKIVDLSLLREVSGLRGDIDKMGKRIEKMASRPINVNNTVEFKEEKPY
tara:strand:- start:5754 stop:9713 length:3960 start_codon:yes stop_codon:yes gene_type:complete